MKIAVINTGGTISCVGDPLAPMSAAEFAEACGSIFDPIFAAQFPDLTLSYVTDLRFPESSTGTLDSTNLQPSDWCLMAGYILDHYAAYDGWIVLHGTDSMDFTGGALPFLLSSFSAVGVPLATLSKPVVLTGSQVPMFRRSAEGGAVTLNYNTDAYQNFCGAVAAAQSGVPEVCVYFDGNLFRGARVVKTNANQFNAFSSPNYPPLGTFGIEFALNPTLLMPPPVSASVSLDDPDALARARAQLDAIRETIDQVPVMQLNAFPAWYRRGTGKADGKAFLADIIAACVAQGAAGLILGSYGEGNFPSGDPDTPSQGAIYQALDAANRKGVVIVDNTQVLQAVVDNSAYAAGAWLPEVGALSPADMTPMAALAKLTVLLAAAAHHGWSADDVRRLMGLSLIGEMIETSRLDSRRNATLLGGQSLTTQDGSAVLRNDPSAGPMLTDAAGNLLWKPPIVPSADQTPVWLAMQNDGNLVLYGRDNAPLWATQTGTPDGASSMLVLAGSARAGSVSLRVYDYSAGRISVTLFEQG
ncbi:asparaginase domain-containing protein [Sphingomonas sp. RS6]